MNRVIAYVMSRFPHLPETFIVREMTELERHGWQVALYPLIAQRQPVVHEEAGRWVPRMRRLPFLSPAVLAANVEAFARTPRRYAALLGRVLRENASSPNFLWRALALWPKAVYAARRMERENVAHVHAHYASHPALVAWIIHRLTGIPYSITAHAHDIFVRTAMLETKLRDAEFVVAISEYNREYLARRFGSWVREKARVIHCGIVPERLTPCAEPAARRERFEVIHVGSLQPYKGQSTLVRACELLRDRGIPIHCRIIGGGEARGRLERMIAGARLEGAVELLGPRTEDEVARLLPTADCYVQPSVVTSSGKMEGIPVAIMEALACALPVVATSISGVPELVRPGDTGLLVPPADAQALADALARVYADPPGAARMGRAGRALVLDRFNLHTNVRDLAALFECVVQSRPRSGDGRLPAAESGRRVTVNTF